jgi:hypothetical protein
MSSNSSEPIVMELHKPSTTTTSEDISTSPVTTEIDESEPRFKIFKD